MAAVVDVPQAAVPSSHSPPPPTNRPGLGPRCRRRACPRTWAWTCARQPWPEDVSLLKSGHPNGIKWKEDVKKNSHETLPQLAKWKIFEANLSHLSDAVELVIVVSQSMRLRHGPKRSFHSSVPSNCRRRFEAISLTQSTSGVGVLFSGLRIFFKVNCCKLFQIHVRNHNNLRAGVGN